MDVQDSFVSITQGELARLRQAESACWSVHLGIGLGLLDGVPLPTRRMIAEGGLQAWVDHCVSDGLMHVQDDEEPTHVRLRLKSTLEAAAAGRLVRFRRLRDR